MSSLSPLTLESLLKRFQARRGLFILGAGASAGAVSFGNDFLIDPALDYVRGSSFPVDLPNPSELTEKIIRVAGPALHSRLFPHRVLRPGSDDFLCNEKLARLPHSYALMDLKHYLAKDSFAGRPLDNYTAFRFFAPSLLLNYNLDGLAAAHCADVHLVLHPHGIVPDGWGSPDIAKFVEVLRDFDLPLPPDGLVISVKETLGDKWLAICLDKMATFSPDYVAIIGYTFGRNDIGHDDWISLAWFEVAFRDFPGNIYIIDPNPEPLSAILSERLKSTRVIGIRAYWNVLSSLFIKAARSGDLERSLNWHHEDILDRLGGHIAFPLNRND